MVAPSANGPMVLLVVEIFHASYLQCLGGCLWSNSPFYMIPTNYGRNSAMSDGSTPYQFL